MPPTVAETLRDTAAQLKAAGIATPALEARLLLAHAAGLDPDALLRSRDAPAPAARLQPLLARRLTHEPLAFITGRTGFWTLDLEVSPATLIPRPDSETLVEAVLAARPYRDAVHRVLDLGTGTGCLLLATLSEYPLAWGLGTDLSPDAAALARRNAAATGLAARASFTAADWAAPLAATFDLVLSNPPYIPGADIAGLMPEVARFEPRRALDGGPDGLAAYRALLAALPHLLAPGALAVFELGAGQAPAVAALAAAAGFTHTTRRDLAGIERAIVLEKKLGIPPQSA